MFSARLGARRVRDLGACVSAWTNFGGFVTVIRVPLGCDSDGDGADDGYAVSVEFEAEVVELVP